MDALLPLLILLAVVGALSVTVWLSAGKLRAALRAGHTEERSPRRAQRAADAMFFASSGAAALGLLTLVLGVGASTSAPGSTMPTMLFITAAVGLVGALGIREYYKLLNAPQEAAA